MSQDEDFLNASSVRSFASDQLSQILFGGGGAGDEDSDQSRAEVVSPSQPSLQRTLYFDQKTIRGLEDESSLVSMDAEELYQQLEEATHKMESLHQSSTKNYPLSADHSLFVDVESGGSDIRADFELRQDLRDKEVLTLRVFCLPSFVLEEDFACNLQKLRVPGADFLPLHFRLVYRGATAPNEPAVGWVRGAAFSSAESDSLSGSLSPSFSASPSPAASASIPVKPTLFNGEYCIALTNAGRALKKGFYALYVNAQENRDDPLYSQHDDTHTQSVQISLQILPVVSATAVSQNSVVRDSVVRNECRYFRFVLTDAKKFIRFSVRPSPQRESDTDTYREVDLELFVTNRFEGLVAPQRESAVWRSVDGSAVEILPTDPQLCAAQTMLQRSRDRLSHRHRHTYTHDGAHGERRRDGERHDGAHAHSEGEENTHSTFFAEEDGSYLYDYHLEEEEDEEEREAHIQTFVLCVCASAAFTDDDDDELSHLLGDVTLTTGDRDAHTHTQQRERARRVEFELEVRTEDLLPAIQTHLTEDGPEDSLCLVEPLLDLRTAELSFHAVEVHPDIASHLLVLIQVPPLCDTRPLSESVRERESVLARLRIDSQSTERVRCSSFSPFDLEDVQLAIAAYQRESIDRELRERRERQQASSSVSAGSEAVSSIQQRFFFTVLYIAHNTMYPGPDCYQFRASGGSEAGFYLNSSDWKYTSNACYFSIFVCDVDAQFLLTALHTPRTESEGDLVDYIVRTRGVSTHSDTVEDAVCHIWRECADDALLHGSAKAQLFRKIFADIDGCKLTYRDREAVDFASANFPFDPVCAQYYHKTSSSMAFMQTEQSIDLSFLAKDSEKEVDADTEREGDSDDADLDDHCLTHSEIEFASFVSLLRAVPAVDGEILYDLGCGAGKAVVASALSGICFLKVVGIEALPSLSTCCTDVLQSLIAQTQTITTSSHAQARERTPSKFGSPSASVAHAKTAQSHTLVPQQLWASPAKRSHEDNLVAWLTQRALQSDESLDDDEMSLQSFLTQSSVSYQVASIPDLRERLKRAKVRLPIMEARNEDFLQSDSWLEADIVFTSSLCFSDTVMSKLLRKAGRLRPGARLVTSKLPQGFERLFRLDKSLPVSLTCGDVLFHVLVRR